MTSDFSNELWQSCQRHTHYPNNLIQVTQGIHARNGIFQKPHAGVKRKVGLFAKEASLARITRVGLEVLPATWKNMDELKDGLNEALPVQYVFIQADYTKQVLCCSVDMFTYLMSFYQVPAAVLDLLSTFKRSELGLDRHFTGFVGEESHSPDRRDSIIPISQLGRSGYYLKQCYRLKFLDKASYRPGAWRAQQVVVHHSFDTINSQSLWITFEGNDALEERMKSMISQCTSTQNYSQAFELTLSTHLMICQWCDETWQEFIESIDGEIYQLKAAFRSADTDSTSILRDLSNDAYSTRIYPHSQPMQQLANATGVVRDRSTTSYQTRYSDLDSSISLDHLGPRDTYDPVDIQKLHEVKDRLIEARLMAKLNSSVLSELGRHYGGLHVKAASRFAGNKSDLEDFIRRMDIFKSRMETCLDQLDELLSKQQRLKELMDDIASYRTLQMNRFFATESRRSADRMEKMTLEATREASSMNVITIVMLIFLPATFTATLMQSGVFQWKDVDTQTHQWLFRDNIFLLFFAISSIMTVGCFLLRWVMLSAKRRRRT